MRFRPKKNPGDMKQGSKLMWGLFYMRLTLTWEYLSSGLHLKWGVVHEYPHIWRALQFDVNSGLERFPKLILVEQLPFHWHKPLEKRGHWLLALLLRVCSLSLKKKIGLEISPELFDAFQNIVRYFIQIFNNCSQN